MVWADNFGKNAAKELEPTLDEVFDKNLPELDNILLKLEKSFSATIDSKVDKAFKLVDTLKSTGALVGLGLTFSSAVFGLVKLYAAYEGKQAVNAFMKLGVEIAKSLKISADCMERQTNLMTQEKFGIINQLFLSCASHFVKSPEQNLSQVAKRRQPSLKQEVLDTITSVPREAGKALDVLCERQY
ncbi:hypothetical protein B0J14DRAFT_645845 [Halenospora varia]|nr:hypothetical protein B0J14DRAFT_645845 [Halenospora varia]